MSDAPQYTSLQDYRRVLRDQRVLVALIIIAFTAAAIVYSVRQTPVYEASAAIDVREENADLNDVGLGVPVLQTPEQRAAIASERVIQPDVARRANRDLERKIPPDDVASYIQAAPEALTNLVVIRASSSSAEYSALVANRFADAAREVITDERRKRYAEQAATFQRSLRTIKDIPANGFTRASLVDRVNKLRNLADIAQPVAVVRRAEVPGGPVSPKPIRNGILGFLLGLTIALITAVVRDALDRRFKSSKEIREALALPLIGHVREELLGRTVVGSEGRALTAAELDVFRIVRTNVGFLDVDDPIKCIAVTSAMPDEGKSTVAGALAAASVLAGSRTLLVECDLRRPTLAKRLGLQQGPGLSDYLVGSAEPGSVLQRVELRLGKGSSNGSDSSAQGSLVCITAGTPTPQPAELLGSQRFRAFLDQVSDVYDAIILDTCPLLSVVDTIELIPHVDGLVVCVRASRTTRDQARAARAAIDHLPTKPSAVVVTGLRAGEEADYGYYSYSYAPSD